MGKFTLKLLIFLAINALLAFLFYLFIQQWDQRYEYKNWESESALLTIPEKQQFDFIVMGSSHGRILSRHQNHQRVENILGLRFLNISKGGGGGIVPNLINYEIFKMRQNETKIIVFFVDPWMFFSHFWNRGLHFANKEPLNISYLRLLLKYGVDKEVIVGNIVTKFRGKWFQNKPYSLERMDQRLNQRDAEAVKKLNEGRYPEGLSQKAYDEYTLLFNQFVKEILKEKKRFIVIMPTGLIENEPGYHQVDSFLQRYSKIVGFEYYNHYQLIKDPALYYDHDHLNTEGIEYYTREYLKGILLQP